jgi:hypothetical protein
MPALRRSLAAESKPAAEPDTARRCRKIDGRNAAFYAPPPLKYLNLPIY